MTDNLQALARAWPQILEGVGITLWLTVGGALLALVVALALGLASCTTSATLRVLARIVIEFFRGTSLVVQLFFLFYVLPLFGVDLHPILVGVMGLGLNYGAYAAEVVRGSINAVPSGQWEASIALSHSPAQRMFRVILPQAWALMIPSLTNLLIQLLKGTAIVSFITLVDLTVQIDKLRVESGDTFFAFMVGLLIYFAIAYLLTLLMNALEVRAKHRLGQGESLRDVLSFRAPAKEVGS
ncbi:ectoine/hydroxyectoine ABC transporter permease subunit EhuC [Brevibacterium litoralis]|uniref:ectoine/hydroxyectoine ABC transporter permease subunit EhuC n=1 Tax=Brevibacterium litoralis TaxID=3138935 RepID=UPI0032EBAD4F